MRIAGKAGVGAGRRTVISAAMSVVALVALSQPSAQASDRATKTYAGNSDPFAKALLWSLRLEGRVSCGGSDGVGAGGACFDVPESAQTVDVEVRDATGPVTAMIGFRDGDGRPMGRAEWFCNQTSSVVVPDGAVKVVVEASAWPAACGAPPAGGSVTASFR